MTFIIDRNVNYTNICHTDCDFCAFYRRPGDRREGYLLPKPVIFKKIEETLAIGGTALLMQGGHHPDLGIEFYEDLFRSIKERYRIHLHALSPPEIQHIARRSKLTIPETLTRLRDAGLDSVPGGGAEILVDRVRDIIAPKKTKSADWLGVMREAHRLGVSSTATMMYGHVETLEERVEHMRRIRELQDETRGFRAFISWTFQPDGTRLADKVTHFPTSFDYLLTQAVSRIYLDNVDHIQSSWVTQGMKVGQVALGFGADDMGSVMIEENVVSAAGTTHRADDGRLRPGDQGASARCRSSATRSTAKSRSGPDRRRRLPSAGACDLVLRGAEEGSSRPPRLRRCLRPRDRGVWHRRLLPDVTYERENAIVSGAARSPSMSSARRRHERALPAPARALGGHSPR